MVVRTALLMAMAGTMLLSARPIAENRPDQIRSDQERSEIRLGARAADGPARPAMADAAPTLLAQVRKPVVYRPPLRGAPTRRVGGATRGDQEWDLVLSVLAPEETGLTARASPTLYWYLSKPDGRPAVFALIRDDRVEPVVELDLGEPSRAGVARVALADAGIELEPGIVYEWSIALVTDPDARSKDVVSSATLLLRAPSAGLRRDLESGGLVDRAALYAGNGYWYDAIGALSAGIDGGAEAAAARTLRADLLDQVGLQDAAAFDRAR